MIGELLELIPDDVKALFGPMNLSPIIDDALKVARLLWEERPALIGAQKKTEARSVGFDIGSESE